MLHSVAFPTTFKLSGISASKSRADGTGEEGTYKEAKRRSLVQLRVMEGKGKGKTGKGTG